MFVFFYRVVRGYVYLILCYKERLGDKGKLGGVNFVSVGIRNLFC